MKSGAESKSDDPNFCDSDSLFTCSSTTSSESESELEESENEVEYSNTIRPKPLKRFLTRGGRADCRQRNNLDHLNTVAVNPQAQAVPTMNEWKNEPNTVEKFSFAENVGMKVDIVGSEPIDVFNLFLTNKIISIMVNETNKYAEQELEKKRPLRRSSRFHK